MHITAEMIGQCFLEVGANKRSNGEDASRKSGSDLDSLRGGGRSGFVENPGTPQEVTVLENTGGPTLRKAFDGAVTKRVRLRAGRGKPSRVFRFLEKPLPPLPRKMRVVEYYEARATLNTPVWKWALQARAIVDKAGSFQQAIPEIESSLHAVTSARILHFRVALKKSKNELHLRKTFGEDFKVRRPLAAHFRIQGDYTTARKCEYAINIGLVSIEKNLSSPKIDDPRHPSQGYAKFTVEEYLQEGVSNTTARVAYLEEVVRHVNKALHSKFDENAAKRRAEIIRMAEISEKIKRGEYVKEPSTMIEKSIKKVPIREEGSVNDIIPAKSSS